MEHFIEALILVILIYAARKIYTTVDDMWDDVKRIDAQQKEILKKLES